MGDITRAVPKNKGTLLTGTGNYTVPAGVYRIFPVLVGGGAGGGGVSTAAATASSGQPGYVVTASMDVTPGQVIAYSCGAKSVGAAAGGTAADGGDTTLGSLIAKGGKGGIGSVSGNAGSPATTAVINAAIAAMAITPTASLFLTALLQGTVVGVGAAGVGGLARSNGYGQPGPVGSNSAGGNATGYGQGGGGAGATSGLSLAGGDGSDGCILL